MLAERVKEWTREWEREGFEKGLEKGLERGLEKGLEDSLGKARTAFTRKLEVRFGPLPEATRKKVEALDSIETIIELSSSIATAPSLAALGLH